MTVPGADPLREAYAAFSRGNLDEGGRLCEVVLARDPRNAKALHLASAIAIRRGRLDVALERVDAAIASDPRDAHQYQTRGQVLRALKRPGAEADFRKAIALDPGFAQAHASLGAALVETDFVEAQRHLERALAKHPHEAEWRYNLALCEIRSGRDVAARDHLHQVLRVKPQWADALNALGGVLANMDDFQAAARALEAAVGIDPRLASAWNNLGAVRMSEGRIVEARNCFARAVEIAPGDANAWCNLGNAERGRGDRPAAEKAYRRALEIAPDLPAALVNLGNTLREMDRSDEAIAALDQAVQASDSPEAHLSLGVTLLLAGDLRRGWSEYRWRRGVAPDDRASSALQEAILAGTPIELAGEQGLGDVLFFLRWATLLQRGGHPLAFRGDERLFHLLESAGIFSRFSEAASPAVAGVHPVPLADLPALLGADAPEHPQPLPLRALPAAVEEARQALRAAGPSPYVAIAWRAGGGLKAGRERLLKQVPLDALGAALREVSGTLVCVQRDPQVGELAQLERALGRKVMDASAWNADLDRIAGMMAAVDAYAGVSSTNVHLCAGLGRRAAILVPNPPEWRYGSHGDRTPWFEGFRLYREDPARGWGDALAQLASGVRDLAG